jgi:hypothetical protein
MFGFGLGIDVLVIGRGGGIITGLCGGSRFIGGIDGD